MLQEVLTPTLDDKKVETVRDEIDAQYNSSLFPDVNKRGRVIAPVCKDTELQFLHYLLDTLVESEQQGKDTIPEEVDVRSFQDPFSDVKKVFTVQKSHPTKPYVTHARLVVRGAYSGLIVWDFPKENGGSRFMRALHRFPRLESGKTIDKNLIRESIEKRGLSSFTREELLPLLDRNDYYIDFIISLFKKQGLMDEQAEKYFRRNIEQYEATS